MCGVVAVLPAPAPTRARDLSCLVQTLESLRIPVLAGRAGEYAMTQLQAKLVSADHLLSDPAAELRLLINYSSMRRLQSAITRLERAVKNAERRLDSLMDRVNTAQHRAVQHALIRIAASLWILRHDRLSVGAIGSLLGATDDGSGIAPASTVTGYGALETRPPWDPLTGTATHRGRWIARMGSRAVIG